jgi:hypothetical protein
MINVHDLKHHVAARNAQGRPVLILEPVPPEFATANAVSRLSYRRAVAAEEQSVIEAAHYATMPDRPAGWDRMSATSRRTWWLGAQKGAGR